MIGVARTFDQTDLYLMDRWSGAPPVAVAQDLPASFDGEVAHGRLFMRTNLDAPTYRLYAGGSRAPGAGALAGDRAAAGRGGARGRARHGPPPGARATWSGRLPGSGSPTTRAADVRELRLPTLGSLFGAGAEWDGEELFYGFSSYTVPPSVYRVDLATGAEELWRRVEADVDPSRFEVRQVSVRSKDGTDGLHVPGAPHRPGEGRQATRCTSPATAASTSA